MEKATQLQRRLGLFDATGIGVGAIVGGGILALAGTALRETGSGAWLAFLSDRGGEWGIWLLHVDSGHLRQIFEFDGGTYTPPAGEPYNQRNWWDEQLSWSR